MTLYKVTVTRTIEINNPWDRNESSIEYYVEEDIKEYGFNHCEVTVEEEIGK